MNKKAPVLIALFLAMSAAGTVQGKELALVTLQGTDFKWSTGTTARLQAPGSASGDYVVGPARSGRSTIIAEFSLDTLPAEPMFVFLTALAGPGSGAPAIEVAINGVAVTAGPTPFTRNWREIRRFAIPAAAFRSGNNVVSIRWRSGPDPNARFTVAKCEIASARFTPLYDLTTGYVVEMPGQKRPFPEPAAQAPKTQGFKIRGTKGWGWTPEQYLAEIPYLSMFGMNFLMNGYTSMFTDAEKRVNRWWEPIPDAKKKAYEEIVRKCRQNQIEFCFAFNPQLYSERPLDLNDDADFERLWNQYAWMQGEGVNWFGLCFDDIPTKGLDLTVLGREEAKLANRLLERLQATRAGARLIFCPVFYYGRCDKGGPRAYLEAVAGELRPDIFMFWTGDDSVTPVITKESADIYKGIVRHPLIIWDNYPTNDGKPIVHLGPLSGRDPELSEIAYGYISNPHAQQNEINRIPLATCADYAANPAGYDPVRSVGQAILLLAKTNGQRSALQRLVQFYPNQSIYGRNQPNETLILERFDRILQEPDGKSRAGQFIQMLEQALLDLSREFPGDYKATRVTVAQHLAQIKEKYRARFPE